MGVKERSLSLILEFRAAERKSKSTKVRKFIPPEPHELNFDAQNLFELVNWEAIDKKKKTPPPILKDLSDEELKQMVSKTTFLQDMVKDKIPKFLCHSQDCERNIQLTTKTVLKRKGHESQKSQII